MTIDSKKVFYFYFYDFTLKLAQKFIFIIQFILNIN